MQSKKDLKLIANDGESIHFLSVLLQDAISCNSWFLLKDNVFKILVNRIGWEINSTSKEVSRTHTILSIHNIQEVKMQHISKKKIEFFSILSMVCNFDSDNIKNNNIKIILSKGLININVSNFLVTMKDVSENWTSPFVPCHEVKNPNN